MKDKKTLSQQRIFMLRQTQLEVEVNSLVTKTAIVSTEVEKIYKKNVVTQKLMLRHIKELKVDISVATKEYYVATIKAAESEISIAIEKFYVAIEDGREVR